MITLTNIYSIFKQIAQFHSSDNNVRVNTFSIINSYSDFNSETLEKTFQNYLDGTFWSRKMENAGGNPSELSFDWGVLGLMLDFFETDARENSGTFRGELLLAYQVKCEGCSDMTRETATSKLFYQMKGILKEAVDFRLVNYSGADHWHSSGRLAYLVSEGLTGHTEGYKVPMLYNGEKASIDNIMLPGIDNLIVLKTPISFQGCQLPDSSWNYVDATPGSAGDLDCEDC